MAAAAVAWLGFPADCLGEGEKEQASEEWRGELDADVSQVFILTRKRRAGGGSAGRRRCPRPSVQRKKKEGKEKIFAENPLGFSVITKLLKQQLYKVK